MKNLMNYRILVTTMSAIVGIVASSRADVTAASFTTSLPITAASTGSNVLGWEFSTSSDIEVTSLGIYAIFGDALSAQHPIGIWNVSDPSQLLVSAIIPAGTVAPIVQSFRYVDINPVTLAAGQDYVIAALYHKDDDLVGSLNASGWQLTMGPDLEFDGYRYGATYPTTTLSFPSGFDPSEQESFGPNFTYNIVPEPSMSSLCVLALTVLFFSRTILPFRSRTGR